MLVQWTSFNVLPHPNPITFQLALKVQSYAPDARSPSTATLPGR